MTKDHQDFEKIINNYLTLWPNEISVSQTFMDGLPSPFKELITAHDKVEMKLEELQDNRLWVLDWSMFKYLNALAKNEKLIVISKIDMNSLKNIYVDDICEWREEFGE